MNVLSLFDGMSCGQIALNRAGIKYDKYFASEIDKYAIKVTMANYPDTIQLGDATKVKADDLPKIDLLIGGSPCQGFSFAGKQLNFDDPRSKLFFEFVRLLAETEPKYFLLENVKMGQEYQDVISECLGVVPIEINSALVSAQNRVRLYWTNIPEIRQPIDKGILLKDVIESGNVDREKSYCIDANYYQGVSLGYYLRKKRRQLVLEQSEKRLVVQDEPVLCGAMRGRYLIDGKRQDGKMKTAGLTEQRVEIRLDEKTNTLTTVQKDNLIVQHKSQTILSTIYKENAKSMVHRGKCGLVVGDGVHVRKLTPTECERLQTVPDGYTDYVSNTQRYKMLGNGWTVDVIAHIFKGLDGDNGEVGNFTNIGNFTRPLF